LFTLANVSFTKNIVCLLDTDFFPSCSTWFVYHGYCSKEQYWVV